jgi:hypothetical protein
MSFIGLVPAAIFKKFLDVNDDPVAQVFETGEMAKELLLRLFTWSRHPICHKHYGAWVGQRFVNPVTAETARE